MSPYRTLPHTADLRVEITASDRAALYAEAGKALTSLYTDRRKVRKAGKITLEVRGESAEELLVNWLNELIYRFEVQKILFSDFKVENLAKDQLKVTARGEEFAPQKHILKDTPKAATYHLLNIVQETDRCLARVVFDV